MRGGFFCCCGGGDSGVATISSKTVETEDAMLETRRIGPSDEVSFVARYRLTNAVGENSWPWAAAASAVNRVKNDISPCSRIEHKSKPTIVAGNI
jgi:hypothetical protein